MPPMSKKKLARAAARFGCRPSVSGAGGAEEAGVGGGVEVNGGGVALEGGGMAAAGGTKGADGADGTGGMNGADGADGGEAGSKGGSGGTEDGAGESDIGGRR